MALNTSQRAIEARRLEIVSALRLRGRTQRQIQEALAKQLVNPATGEPYSLATINIDLKKLEREWRKNAAESIEEHKARQLAEIGEIKRQAWNDKDPALVLRAIDLEANIIGTKAAVKNEHTGAGGGPVQVEQKPAYDLSKLSTDELRAWRDLAAKAGNDASANGG